MKVIVYKCQIQNIITTGDTKYMKLEIQTDELWYGALTNLGIHMPFTAESKIDIKLDVNMTPNQGMPFLVSSEGRWIWLNVPYSLSFHDGMIEFPEGSGTGKAGETLKDAYLYVNSTYFPQSDSMPDERLFTSPIFNTWIEYTFFQSKKNTLEYAENILKAGFKPGVLMIDDSWAESYGTWSFHSGRFPHPEKMLEKLHKMGFTVILWICPYITPDTLKYREARNRGLLLSDRDGKPFLCDWWNGYSAALDLSNREALVWLEEQMDKLTALGVDGFKFDGADPMHYIGAYHGNTKVDCNEMARIWAEFGSRWPLNEMRASWEAAAKPNLQRLSDKDHTWGDKGIRALVPDTLALGIMGHPYSCPDMIGGGEYLNFEANSDRLDTEIFIRHAATAALMPAIQFSAAPWRILSQKDQARIHKLIEIREKYLPYIMDLMKKSASTNEPIARYMEYVFPHQGFGRINDQFMVGNELLVAPVLEKGKTSRMVTIPEGNWSFNEKTIKGGRTVELEGNDIPLIVLEREAR